MQHNKTLFSLFTPTNKISGVLSSASFTGITKLDKGFMKSQDFFEKKKKRDLQYGWVIPRKKGGGEVAKITTPSFVDS